MKFSQQHIEQAQASRAHVIEQMGSDRGYAGHFLKTKLPCAACDREGHTRWLEVRVPDGVVTEAILCQIHGEIC